MELISNLFQFAVTLLGFCMSGIRYLKGRKQRYFLEKTQSGLFPADLLLRLLCPWLSLLDAVSAFVF